MTYNQMKMKNEFAYKIYCWNTSKSTTHNIQYTTQRNTTQHYTTQHNTTQHNTTQHNTTQHNTTQYNTTQHNTLHTIQNITVPITIIDLFPHFTKRSFATKSNI